MVLEAAQQLKVIFSYLLDFVKLITLASKLYLRVFFFFWHIVKQNVNPFEITQKKKNIFKKKSKEI